MLRITTGLLFFVLTLLGVFGLSVAFTKAFDVMGSPVWLGFAVSALIFVMGCIGLFILITTKTNITISKQFAVEKQPEVKKNKKK